MLLANINLLITLFVDKSSLHEYSSVQFNTDLTVPLMNHSGTM